MMQQQEETPPFFSHTPTPLMHVAPHVSGLQFLDLEQIGDASKLRLLAGTAVATRDISAMMTRKVVVLLENAMRLGLEASS
nr:unnamed protein product [Digitaria exilis]